MKDPISVPTQPQWGGYRSRAGASKGAWSVNIVGQSFYLQSSYEVRMAALLNKANILWERPESIPYSLDGKQRRYYPDFLLPEYQVYLDTKNDYLMKIDAAKIAAVKHQSGISLFVVGDKEIVGNHLATIIPTARLQLESTILTADDLKKFQVTKRKRPYVPRPKKARKTKMPAVGILQEMIWKMPLSKIAVHFGVGDTAVQKWLNKLKIDRPPHGYWVRRQNGWSHEEALSFRTRGKPIPRRFTDEQVMIIRSRITAGEKLLRLAREYGVCHKTMRDIRDGLRYKNTL